MRAYVNGVKVGEVQGTAVGISDKDLFLGCWYDSATGSHERFLRGSLAEVRIYNRALSAEEIKELASFPSR